MALGDFSVGDGAIGDSAALLPTIVDVSVAVIAISGGAPVVNPITILPYGAIGDASVGDDAIGGESAPLKNQIDVSSASVGVTANAPNIIVGVLLDVPAASVAVVAVAPALLEGVLLDVPAASVAVIGAIPQFVNGANIVVGTAPALSVSANAPQSGAGASVLVDSIVGIAAGGAIGDDAVGDYGIGIGAASATATLGNARVALQALAPTLFAGVTIDVPAAAIPVLACVPQILQSANIFIPAAAMVAVYGIAPSVSGGSNLVVPAVAGISVSAIAPQFFPGSLVDIGTKQIAMAAFIPEIDSRRRRIGVHAIAS
jgi:hypothetical protein